MPVDHRANIKATLYAASTLAFASVGDAFLYPYLPLNFAHAGVPAVWVGILLSINRFVRIVSNSLLVHALATFGLRAIVITAACGAIASTFGYALATGVVGWLTLRIIWGLSFSALRIGAVGYALQQERVGFSLGLSKSLQESGPMLTLFIAPLLLENVESRSIFYVLALISLPALFFATKLPSTPDKPMRPPEKRVVNFPSLLNTITFSSAFLIDGVLVVVLGVLLQRYGSDLSIAAATTLAALYLGYRRICLVVLSPIGGWVADRVGISRIYTWSITAVLLGLLSILFGYIAPGALIVFGFYSVNAAVAPGAVSDKGCHPLAAIAENATWRDLGAATGTLTGGFLIFSEYFNMILATVIVIMAFLIAIQFQTMRKASAKSSVSKVVSVK
jgi:MFS transporter, DHA1 family, multidrug resistance protein